MPKVVLDVGNCTADHAALLDLIESNFDARVVAAHTPSETLDTLRAGNFDLVLINRKLDRDNSDGLDVVQQIKAEAAIAEVPVMLITNYDQYQELAVAAGAELGFGKDALHEQSTRDKLQRFLA